MNGDDEEYYKSRSGMPVVFRTQPGAPPSAAQTRDSLTPQSDWTRMFANTPGSTYTSSFNKPTASSTVMGALDEVGGCLVAFQF